MKALFLEEENEFINLNLVEKVTIEKATNKEDTFLISFHFQSGKQEVITREQSKLEDFISQIIF